VIGAEREREQEGHGAGAERRAGVTKVGLSGDSHSAHMLCWPRYAVYKLSVTLLHFLESPTVSLVILYTMPEYRARVTLKHDGTYGTDATSNCFEEDVRIAISKTAQTGQLIVVLAASDNPRQTMHNVKITFINLDFLKMNECNTIAIRDILHTEQESCCRKEAVPSKRDHVTAS